MVLAMSGALNPLALRHPERWPEWQTQPMNIEEWWPKLKPSTRKWLMDNNGDRVPAEIVADITEAGVSITSNAWWVGESGSSGFYLSDDACDWIEAVANHEQPDSPGSSV